MLEQNTSWNPNPLAVLIVQFSVLKKVKSHLTSVCPLEDDLLSMILHWEVAARKTVTEPELLELKKLCKDKNLFLKLGYGPLMEQENSITEWLTKSKEEEAFRDAVQKMITDFKGKEKLPPTFFLTIHKPDVVHALILKVIHLLDKISRNKKMLQKFERGKFHNINKQIESIFKNNSEVKKIFEKVKTSDNLEDDITSLMLKISDESSSELFRVNSCAKCGYKLDPKIGMDKSEGKNSSNMSVCLSNIYLSENFPVFQTFF